MADPPTPTLLVLACMSGCGAVYHVLEAFSPSSALEAFFRLRHLHRAMVYLCLTFLTILIYALSYLRLIDWLILGLVWHIIAIMMIGGFLGLLNAADNSFPPSLGLLPLPLPLLLLLLILFHISRRKLGSCNNHGCPYNLPLKRVGSSRQIRWQNYRIPQD